MALQAELKLISKTFEGQQSRLDHNRKLFEIFEGALLKYVLEELRSQLHPKSFEQAQHRVAPINILRRLTEKLSKIYAKPPVRIPVLASGDVADPANIEIVQFYEREMRVNEVGNSANEFFNLMKSCAIEPFLYRGRPRLRVIPADRFFVLSTDSVNPLRPTHFAKVMGDLPSGKNGANRTLLYVYTDEEFMPMWSDGTPAWEAVPGIDGAAAEGKNPYGRIPFVYVSRSKHELVPQIDTDTLKMSTLLPVLLTDLNYATMYTSFGMIYAIDAEIEQAERAPNAVWQLKTAMGSTNTPQLGTIKPEVDTDKVLTLIKSQVALWLQSRNIKPGSMGDLSVENASSGIAKAIDEMDTSEDRQAQVQFFQTAEEDLWDLILNHMHPVWSRTQGYPEKRGVARSVSVQVTFAEQRPIVDSSKAIADQVAKIQAGLQSRSGALKELYPDWSEEMIEQKLAEIDQEGQSNEEAAGSVAKDQAQGDDEAEGETTGKGASEAPEADPQEMGV